MKFNLDIIHIYIPILNIFYLNIYSKKGWFSFDKKKIFLLTHELLIKCYINLNIYVFKNLKNQNLNKYSFKRKHKG